ncbi:MAG: lyase [Pseudomonadota bacterium]
MTERYEPKSEFLRAVLADEIGIEGDKFALDNFSRLLTFFDDECQANRDWAVFLVAQSDVDSPQVRRALTDIAGKSKDCVRDEALWGLARRDRNLALPLVKQALLSEGATTALFEAAEVIADPSLTPLLKDWGDQQGDVDSSHAVSSAIDASQKAHPDKS